MALGATGGDNDHHSLFTQCARHDVMLCVFYVVIPFDLHNPVNSALLVQFSRYIQIYGLVKARNI